MTGSPPGPCKPSTCLPRVTVPNPPLPGYCVVVGGGVWDEGFMHPPPPSPAKSTNVVAVRFISPPVESPRFVRFSKDFDYGIPRTLHKPGIPGTLNPEDGIGARWEERGRNRVQRLTGRNAFAANSR